MYCCLLVAFLCAQLVAMFRRWGQYVGLVAADDWSDGSTLAADIKAYLARPLVRKIVLTSLLVECAALGGWLWVDHRVHAYELIDQGIGIVTGNPVAYVTLCDSDGKVTRIRWDEDSIAVLNSGQTAS